MALWGTSRQLASHVAGRRLVSAGVAEKADLAPAVLDPEPGHREQALAIGLRSRGQRHRVDRPRVPAPDPRTDRLHRSGGSVPQVPDLDDLVESGREELRPSGGRTRGAYGSAVAPRVDDRDRLGEVGERGLGEEAPGKQRGRQGGEGRWP